MKKKQLTAAVMAGVMLLGTACSSGSGGGGSAQTSSETEAETASETAQEETAAEGEGQETAGTPVTLKVANYAVLEKGYDVFWEGVKEGFEAEYPNITIEWVTAPYAEILSQVINMAGGGDRVDCIFSELTWIPDLVDAGLAMPLDDVLDQEFLDDYYSNILEAHTVDGKLYGAPLYVSPFILFYNKDLFEKAGLDPEKPPTTYDEMLEMAEALSKLTTEDGNKIYAFGEPTASTIEIGSYTQAFVANFGGQVLDENGGLAIDNEGFRQAAEMLQLLDEKGYNPQNAKPKDLRNLFALGQLAMYYDKSGGMNGVLSINPEAKNFAAATVPLKGGDGNGASTLQSHCFVGIDNGEEQKEALKAFIQYVISPEVMNDYIEIAPWFPAKKSMEDMENVKNSAILTGAQGAVEISKPLPLFTGLSNFNLELCAFAQAITVGDEDIDTATEQLKESSKAILP